MTHQVALLQVIDTYSGREGEIETGPTLPKSPRLSSTSRKSLSNCACRLTASPESTSSSSMLKISVGYEDSDMRSLLASKPTPRPGTTEGDALMKVIPLASAHVLRAVVSSCSQPSALPRLMSIFHSSSCCCRVRHGRDDWRPQ